MAELMSGQFQEVRDSLKAVGFSEQVCPACSSSSSSSSIVLLL